MVEILGTNLRTNCACSGNAGDFRELFECIEYQRLFWVNPCVGELKIMLLKQQREFIIRKRKRPQLFWLCAIIAIYRDFPGEG